MEEIKFDKRNYRKHNDRNKDLIRKSLNECGAGRSIVIDNNNEIIAGNGIYEQAQELGIKTKIVETDGSELIVVKRTDLSTEDEKRRKLAIMDNSTSDSSEFNIELLRTDFDIPELKEFGIESSDDEIPQYKEQSKYTRKITVPVYEIKGEKPAINEMVNDDKVKYFLNKIDESNLNNEIKEFLRKTATRFYEFRYDKIAEFYAHADKETQALMEDMILVIVDFDKAIENGYVKLNKFIEDCFLEENNINE